MDAKKILLLLLVILFAAPVFTSVYAQGGGGYDLSWWTIDGGGGEVSGGDFKLTGTAGQYDAHNALTGGDFALSGGFWAPEETASGCAIPLTGIQVTGSSSGQPNVALVYTANPQPGNAATPITYTWSADGLQSGQGAASATYQWSGEGNKSVQLSAQNCGGQLFTDTKNVNISATCAQAVTGTTITGQNAGYTNVSYEFDAGFAPANATGPVTYAWSPDGLQSGQGTSRAAYQWSAVGAHTVSITTTNCGGSVNNSRAITLTAQPASCTVPINSVSIGGVASGEQGKVYTFTAALDPLNATTPITYVWSSDNLVNGQGTAGASYRWTQAGDYSISLSAANCGGGKNSAHIVRISAGNVVYLPLVLK
jgi:hypothetical protein